MPHITREDGERFIIPSYRDVLTVRQKSELKREIQVLSQNYGEYITLQRKNPSQYEVAFSDESGYLLGETVWHYFNKPNDMVYCEAIPNTTEAILVIVKNGSVYLDGSFPLDSIQEELITFLTEQNNFEVYIYGDVPISREPTPNKFSFEPNAIKSFTILDKSAFARLPLLRMYLLQLVDVVLQSHGIGVFPTERVITFVILLGALWMLYSWLTHRPVTRTIPQVFEIDPYAEFTQALATPDPYLELTNLLETLQSLFTLPGWTANSVQYRKGVATVLVHSDGGTASALNEWANRNNAALNIQSRGINLAIPIIAPKSRSAPTAIYPLKDILIRLIDNIAKVYPGNRLAIQNPTNKRVFSQVQVTLNFQSIAPFVVDLLGQQLKNLPIVLQSVSITLNNGSYSGSITFDVYGN